MDISLVIPLIDEAESLPELSVWIEKVMNENNYSYEIIYVDDGSSDPTAEIVRKYKGRIPCTLLVHAFNRGLGATIRDGLLKAIEQADDGDVIVTMDADDTHTPGAIVDMVAKIDQGYDVLIASRYQKGSLCVGVPWLRRFVSYAGSLLFRAAHPVPGVRDFTCGYRAYRAAVLRQALKRYRREFIDQDGFQCMVDILLKLSRMKLQFGEVPLVLRYDRKGGKSKMKLVPTAYRTLLLLFRRRLGF